MTIEELKQEIEQHTGVPAHLLTGESIEENMAQAKALIAYRRQQEHDQQPQDTRSSFSKWMKQAQSAPDPDGYGAALDDLAKRARMEAGGYPEVEDGGNPYINGRKAPDTRPTHEQFSEWLVQVTER